MRFGAGRPGLHKKAEQCQRIDVRQWQRCGALRDGYMGSWVWHRDGKQSGSIGYTVDAESVTLRYSVADTAVNNRIEIERTPCNYGGSRPWFLCWRCGSRPARPRDVA